MNLQSCSVQCIKSGKVSSDLKNVSQMCQFHITDILYSDRGDIVLTQMFVLFLFCFYCGLTSR